LAIYIYLYNNKYNDDEEIETQPNSPMLFSDISSKLPNLILETNILSPKSIELKARFYPSGAQECLSLNGEKIPSRSK
jgi:hypothetical protein